MLTWEDEPTIRNAIQKRLGAERGISIWDIPIEADIDCIRIGILARIDNTLMVRSRFDLPPEFELMHLHNEIDEIAEHCKAARADFWAKGRCLERPEHQLIGTGLRGRWHE